MAEWSDIASTYAESVQGLLPLHRACIFLTGFTSSLAIERNEKTPITHFISNIKISELTTFSNSFLSDATGFNVICGLISIIAALITSSIINKIIYQTINNATKFIEEAISLDRSWKNELSLEERKILIEIIDQGTSDAKSRIQRFAAMGELLIGISIILLIASISTGATDFFTGIGLLLTGLIVHAIKMHIFFKDYFGPALTKSHLQGRRLPTNP